MKVAEESQGRCYRTLKVCLSNCLLLFEKIYIYIYQKYGMGGKLNALELYSFQFTLVCQCVLFILFCIYKLTS